jgi:glucan phosphoethanolaminetransferase (alkaline phosphatase superfamily)
MFVVRAGPPIFGYIGGAALSLAVWGLALEAARHPRLAARLGALLLIAVTAFFGVGGQILFHATAHNYFNRDAVLFSIQMWPIIYDYLMQSPAVNLGVLFGASTLAVAYAVGRHRVIGPRRRFATLGAALAVVACLLAALLPLRVAAFHHGLPPDVLFWNAAGGVGLYALGLVDKPRVLPPGRHLALPPGATPVAAGAPDIVLLFGESVRRDEVCASMSADCKKSPRLDEAAPRRIGFTNSFAVASCTDVSSVVLWTGLSILTSIEAMQTAPLLWDYAKARGYRTGYLTSQNLFFQDQGNFLRTSRIDEKREARDRIEHGDLDIGSPDEGSAAEALAFLEEGGAPAFVVLHFSNTHLPYRQVPGYTHFKDDPGHAGPGSPAGSEAGRRHARYLNSLAHHDAVIGDFLGRLRETERGKRAIVIYTADHGEAWGEHKVYAHTLDLYGEQINVPLWIDAPPGALSADRMSELRAAAASRPVYTPDVSATILDLLSAYDEPAFEPSIAKLSGASLLRPPPPQRDMILSNCPPFRGCSPDSWGVVRWPLKYQYVGRSFESVCIDLEADPAEGAPLPPEKCRALRELMTGYYGARPDRALARRARREATEARE